MAFWPRDDRAKKKPPARNNELAKEQNRNYPHLEPGLIGAATLVEDENKQFKWAFLNTPANTIADSKQIKFGKCIEVFPPTRPVPTKSSSGSIRQQAEQGANFLRMFLPEVEIASDLIRDQLAEEAALYQELERFDPYAGNVLEYLEPPTASDLSFLLFPAGETNTDLNISSISQPGALQVIFRTCAVPAYKFSTPIRQIVAFKDKDVSFGVRTYGALQFFKLKPRTDESENISVTELASISNSDTAADTVVDVNCLPSADILLVTDAGTVFQCHLGDGRKEINSAYKSYLSSDALDNEFWRLSTGKCPYVYSVMSSEKVWQHDMRTDSAEEVFTVPGRKHCLTSIDDYGHDHTFCLASTKQIIWMDRRFLNKPLLAYSHGREYDRYLAVNTIQGIASKPLTLLTTRNNALTTIYDVSQSPDGLSKINSLPYALSPETGTYSRHMGQKIFQRGETVALARLSEQGSVEYSELLSDTNPQVSYTVDLLPEIHELAAASTSARGDIGPRGLREFAQVDIHPAYDALFYQHFQEAKDAEDDKAEAIYQLVDHFPSYMQIKDPPADHMLTTFDIAFRAGEEPGYTSRADFLTENLVNSKRGYRALRQGNLSPDLVKAPWHRSILPTLRKLDKHFPADPKQSLEYTQMFNLTDVEDRPSTCRQYEQEACEQLTLDLALSSDIFSDTPVSRVGQTLEVMTEALSLGDEPPTIDFGYLKPQQKFFSNVPGESQSDTLEFPIGVRLLLKEWDDTDVDDYTYRDPYDVATSLGPPKALKPAVPNQRRQVKAGSQRPPQILASSGVPQIYVDVPRIPIAKVQSQEHFPSRSAAARDFSAGFSQDLNVSTQVLPGPHGGRPGVKKKTAKKRLGGF